MEKSGTGMAASGEGVGRSPLTVCSPVVPQRLAGCHTPVFLERVRKVLRNKEMSCRARQKSERKSKRAHRSPRSIGARKSAELQIGPAEQAFRVKNNRGTPRLFLAKSAQAVEKKIDVFRSLQRV